MIGAVIGLQFAIAANRNSGLGVVLLLRHDVHPGLVARTPAQCRARDCKMARSSIGIAAIGTGGILVAMA